MTRRSLAAAFEWDTACPADQWRHSHNYMHHTHTNIVGMDRDIGYGILRMSEDQKWSPYFLGNPVYAFLLMVLFQYGVALHELETERIRSGEIRLRDKREVLRAIWKKTRRQTLKDYVAFPLLAGPFAPFVFTGNLTANLMRNVWSYMIIFCGHFPDGTQEFTVEETKDESRGMWYFRQVLGSANLTGGKLFHLLSGNLSHQIEHHLFPDMPARRYAEIAPEVQEICERYGIPYNKGPLPRQFGTVVRKIVKLALPGAAESPCQRACRSGACRRVNGAQWVRGMDRRPLCGQPNRGTSTWIDADPARVWSLVSDIQLMPTLSNELQRVEWVDGADRPRVGARFVGYNEHEAFGQWSTHLADRRVRRAT